MKKLYTIIAAATMTIAAAASGSTLLSPGARPFEPRVAPAAQAPAGLELRQIPESGLAAPRKAQASLPARDAGWNEVGRAAFPEDFVQWVGNVLAQYGAEDHGWNSVFAVEVESDPNPESSTKMLRFRGVFNNANIYLDVDKSTGEIAGRGSTGIPIPGGPDAGLNEEFGFYVSGRYHEAAGRFIFDHAFILIDGDWGYYYLGPEFVLDGAPEVVFEVPESAFVPAEDQQAEISVGRSANVAWYRVVVRERAMSSKEFMAYYAKVPAYAPCAYADYTAESFAAMPFQSGIETKYYVIPFDSQGRALADYSMLRLFYNYDYHHGYNAEWRSLGAGRMEENAANYGIPFENVDYSFPLFSSNPEVEMSADGSLLCVKNPFGPTHPAYGDLIPNTQAPRGEDFYMVFDVSDPSRVVALESLSGMIARYDNAQMAYSCSARAMMDTGISQDVIDSRRDNVWGKFADNRLTMPRYGAIGVSSGEGFSFTLELPGYVDYDVEVAEKGTLEGGVFRFPMSRVSPNVTTVDYALVPMADYEADHNFPERIIAAMADRYAVRSVAASELSASMTLGIPDEEVPYGQWALAVVGRDAAGNRHAGMVFPDAVRKARPVEEWEDAGIAIATDNSLQGLFNGDITRRFKVRVLRNPDNPDILLLQDYYRNLFDSYGWEGFYEFHAEEADLFVLNLSGDYPVLTNDLSGARSGRMMSMGIRFPVSDVAVYCPHLINDFDVLMDEPNTGWVARGDDGNLEYVVMDNALRCVFYNLVNGESSGYGLCSAMMLDFTYDPATDYENPENWKHAGTATVTENIVGQLFGAGENTTEHNVFACSFEEGLYVLGAPLAGMPFAAYGAEYSSGVANSLYIHAADPGKVYLTRNPGETLSNAAWGFNTGWTGGNGYYMLCMVANAVATGALADGWIIEEHLGTFDREKGEIVLDDCFYHYFPSEGRVNKPENPRFRVVLGESSGIDEAATAGAAVVSVEYYSVDGRRLAAPADGLSIRRTRYSDGRIVTDKVVF